MLLVDVRTFEDPLPDRFIARRFADVLRMLQAKIKDDDIEYLKIEAVPELPVTA
jgi:hypothetical protein